MICRTARQLSNGPSAVIGIALRHVIMYEQVMEAITREQNSKIVQFEMSENIGCLVQGGSMFGDE